MLSLISRGQYPKPVESEFQHLIGRLRALLSQVLDADGALIVTDPNLAVVPVGALQDYAAATAPSGWLLCDGSQVSRVTYQALFNIIGTTYGAGDGSTTFNLPDTRGKFSLSKAAAGTGSTLGATGGAIDHVHTGPSHTHTGPSHTHTGPSHAHDAGTLAADSGGSHSHGAVTGANGDHNHGGATGDWGHDDSFSYTAGGTFQGIVGTPHNHSISSSGTHAHSITSDSGHTHTISGGTAANGTGNTGASGTGNTSADGTGNTGTNNPPFITFTKIIFTGVAA